MYSVGLDSVGFNSVSFDSVGFDSMGFGAGVSSFSGDPTIGELLLISADSIVCVCEFSLWCQ